MYILTRQEEILCKEIVDCAYKVHTVLGAGLLEKVYERCFCHELYTKGIKFDRQIKFPVTYKGIQFDEALQLDVLVENIIVCELKAVDQVNPVWEAQILSHMRLLNKHVGFLINFNVLLI